MLYGNDLLLEIIDFIIFNDVLNDKFDKNYYMWHVLYYSMLTLQDANFMSH